MRLLIPFILFCVFIIAGVLVGYQTSRPVPESSLATKIAEAVNNEIARIDIDAGSILENILRQADEGIGVDYEYPFLFYRNNNLVSWSSNSIVPPEPLIADTFSIKLLKTSGGDYLAKKWIIDKDRFLLALLPLHKQYTIRNNYLQPEWNKKIFPEGNINILEPDATIGTPVCLAEQCVFRINLLSNGLTSHGNTGWIAVMLITIAIAFLVVFVFRLVSLASRTSWDLAFIILSISLWLIREVMTRLDFPGRLVNLSLFDPQVFASSSLNRSLGDLVLNSLTLAVICYFLFRNYFRFNLVGFTNKYRLYNSLLSFFCALIFFFSWLFPFVVIQTIYNNSAIVIDVSQSLQFDTLRIAALLVVIFSWVNAFLFAYVSLRILISSSSRYMLLIYVIIAASVFIIINELSGQLYRSSLIIALIYLIVVYGSGLYRRMQKVSYLTYVYLFIALIAFSVLSTTAIQHFTLKERIENQFRFANNFLIDRDYFGEYLLHEVGHKVSSDLFIQSRITSPFLGKDAIRQKTRQVFLPSYFNKYDVEVLLFDGGGHPINNVSSIVFADLINAYNKETFQTDYDGVYFVNSPTADVTQRYLVVSPINRMGITVGYVVLELLLKRFIPESVYPELLIDNRFQQFYETDDISYAVYGKDILYASGTFNYERQFKREYLGDPEIHLKGITKENYAHVAVEDANNRVAVVSTPLPSWTYVMANFSFLLVLGLALLLIFILIQGLITFIQGRTLFYSARIQLVLNLAFFLPLIIVSVTTLRLASTTSQEQLNEEYLNKSRSFGTQMESILEESIDPGDVNRIDFENQLTDMAKLFNVDANVYSPQGNLIASTQKPIFETGLIAPYINPEALQKIRVGDNNLIATEKVGNLNYFVSFAALKSAQTGQVIGILALPFFQSQNSLEKIQIRALANILNVFAVIFIVLIVLSYIVSQWLTFPLKFITRSLSRTTLTRNNEPLKWGANDEIGIMVKEYNQMLYKLSESKAELEQTQRERAWREMAQQVAHEIKNPLTPMKLTLQQLERLLNTDADAKEKTIKALSTLLSQVDTLNDIASSFSTFAKMPEPDIQRIELVGLLKRSVDLHAQTGTINFKPDLREAFVMGDSQLLGRIFSNIILNAFQASRPGVAATLDINIRREREKFKISFQDNGKGIDAKLAERVFIPHFSTKRSGSGLGLAIAKQGIEHMKGKIWFESEEDKGTTFYIELLAAS